VSIKPCSAILKTAVLILGTLSIVPAQAQEQSAGVLAAKLETHFKPAKMGPDFSVTQAGTVLVVQKDGLLGIPPNNPAACTANFRDGELVPPSGFSKALCGNVTRAIANGEKVYVLKIEVNSKKDKVTFLVVECDSCNAAPQFASYKSSVAFQYPKDYLASAMPEQIEDVIHQVFAFDNPPVQAAESQSQAPAPSGPALTNDDVIKLVKEKLPDSVILAKIKSSACDFDTSTDGLIKLKRAGISDAVLQAIVDAPPTAASSDSAGSAPPAASGNQSAPPSAAACGSYDACMKMAEVSFGSSQWARALAAFQQAAQLDPSKGDPWTGSGKSYFQMAQYDDAANMWDKALQLGSTLSFDMCHVAAFCADKGQFLLSTKEVSFVNKKGEKELSATPATVTSEPATLVNSNPPSYFLQIRFGKNWRFYYLPKNIACALNFACPEPGATQQKAIADYIHGALVRMAAGELASSPNKP